MANGNGQGTGEASKVLFCGDRDVGARIVDHITLTGGRIVGLGLPSPPSPHSQVIADRSGVPPASVFYGRSFASPVALRRFEAEAPDLGVCCGFASILPKSILALPRWGWVNIHRSYLPYNRGLDPLQWAVVEGTPAGVSVHVMTEQIDAGPIVAQAEMPVFPTDDGDALEARADALAFDLFRSCWPRVRDGDLSGSPQDEDLATYHSLADCDALRRLDPAATIKVGRLLDILRCYSGRHYSGVNFTVGLLRMPFSVHTRIRLAGEPAGDQPVSGAGSVERERPTGVLAPMEAGTSEQSFDPDRPWSGATTKGDRK